MIRMAYTNIVIPNTKDKISYTIKVQNRRKHLEEQIVSGKY